VQEKIVILLTGSIAVHFMKTNAPLGVKRIQISLINQHA
jgi:hypothetical protein